jgi:thioredoxin 1
MPTFIVLKKGAEADRIQGADRDKLTASVERFARDAKSTVIQGKGYTLGGSSSGRSAAPPAFVRDGVVTNSLPAGHRITGFIDTCVMFLGLYIVSLFSLDAMAAAEASGFGVSGATRNRGVGGIGPSGRRLGTVQGLH